MNNQPGQGNAAREMSLDEYAAQLPAAHRVNIELRELKRDGAIMRDERGVRLSRGDIAHELSATFDIDILLASRIAIWVLGEQSSRGGISE